MQGLPRAQSESAASAKQLRSILSDAMGSFAKRRHMLRRQDGIARGWMGRWPKLFTLTSGIAVAPGMYVSCAVWRRRSLSRFRSSDLLSPRASDALVALSSFAERASPVLTGDFDAGDVNDDGFGRGGSSCCFRFLAAMSSSATRLAFAVSIAALERSARSSRKVYDSRQIVSVN